MEVKGRERVMVVKGRERFRDRLLESEIFYEIVYILFLIIMMTTTNNAGLRGVDNVIDNWMHTSYNPIELKAVLFRNITSCRLGIISNTVRTAIVVWGELKFSLRKYIGLYVIIALQVLITLYIVYSFVIGIGLATAKL